ncbi:unnamed protein product [Mesocestoides corti]|nr:unnamed protein product [Mesocestoides corti]
MSSSVVGFDVGSVTSYIGAAKGGGVEIIANEVSDRCTPSCVAFNGASRFLGSAAEQQMVTNIANTVTSFSRLIGKMGNDPIVKIEREFAFYQIVCGCDGRAAIQVQINGNSVVLLPEQVLAMHLHKLAEIAEANLGTKIVDVVLSAPSYFTDRERRALLDASRIAGLNCMRIVSETTAIGIAYGLTKKDLPSVDQPPRNVAFVSLGNSSLQIAVISFNAGKMKVVSAACDPCLGGRDFDMCIFNHVAKEIEEKYNLKVLHNKKASLRLLKSCERLKKVMSTNSTKIPINVECLMDDTDISSSMNREFFESLCVPLLVRIKATMEKALAQSNLKPGELHSVELVGGGTRIPAVKKLVKDVFGMDGSTTLNADEAVARGCALQAAICSPAFKVREFSIVDACPYSISLHWKPTDELLESVNDDGAGELAKGTTTEVFKHLANFPSSKQLKFYRKGDFTLTACYSNPESLHIANPSIGTFKITNVVPTPPDSLCQVRIKARVNSNGIFTISNAVIMDRVEKEVDVPAEDSKAETTASAVTAQTKMDAVSEASVVNEPPKPPAAAVAPTTDTGAEQLPAKQKKVVLRPRDIPVEATTSHLSHEQLLEFTDFQAKLNQHDKIERERLHLKNALEAYVYEMRDKLETCLLQHTTVAERDSFKELLNETEDWIYGEGEDAKKSVISNRLDTLKQTGDRFCIRFSEFESRPLAIRALSNACENIQRVVESYSSGDSNYDHLCKEDMTKVENALRAKQQYLQTFLETVGKLQPTSDPSVFSADLYNAKNELDRICNPIISRPKPAPPPPPPAAASTENCGTKNEETNKGHVDDTTPNSSAKSATDLPNDCKEPKAPAAGEDMDVD